MEKDLRLRKNIDFQAVFKKGTSSWNRQFTLIIKKNNLSKSRIGFTITKKYGTAVERNKLKRRLREIIRNNKQILFKGYDIVLIPKASTKDMSYQELESSVNHHKKFPTPNVKQC